MDSKSSQLVWCADRNKIIQNVYVFLCVSNEDHTYYYVHNIAYKDGQYIYIYKVVYNSQ